MAKYRKQIEAWAEENYAKSFAASAIVECWDESDYAAYDEAPNAQAALKAVRDNYCEAMDERYAASREDF